MYFNQFFEMEEPVKDNADGPLVTKDYVIAYGHSKISKNAVFGIGDKPAGTSNVISKSTLKNKQRPGDRSSSKPSQIPRYRYRQKEPPILEIPTKSVIEHAMKGEKSRRKLLMKPSIEKMQLHNRKPGIHSDTQSESSSAIITKVLLEEIRGRNKIGSDRLNEWLMESATDYLRPIANCLVASNISSTMVPHTSQSECDVNTRMSIEKRLIEALSNKNRNAIIALDKNMPYIDFEDLELDMRPEQDLSNNDHVNDHVKEITNLKNTEVTTNAVFENCILKTKEYFKSKSQRKKAEKDVEKIVERKADHSRVEDAELRTNETKKSVHYNVGSAGDHLTETENNLSGTMYDATEPMPTSSYVDCPSEILQRMTNLEAEGYDVPSTVSGTDIEIRDDFLSNYNFEQAYSSLMEGRSENWILDNCNDSLCCIVEPPAEESNICHMCSSRTGNQEPKKDVCDSHDYHHHYCWRREVAKRCSERTVRYRGRCKKCHKHRNNQIRIPRPFITFTKHLSVGRICRRRWNLMWKGTAERWASKPKSHSKCRTFATMLDLQRSGFWENADVQTTVLLYHEAGTDAIAKEQKSTDIVPSPKLYSEAYTKIESDTSIDRQQSQKQPHQVGPSTGVVVVNTKNTNYNPPEESRRLHPPSNSNKTHKNDISTCIDPIEDFKQTTTIVTLKEKGINKKTDFANSTKYRSQIDQAIETEGSLLLITKRRSSVSINSDIAMVVNLNAHEAFNQTEELEKVEVDTEVNINYNNSLEISCDDSSLFSYDVDFYKPHPVETESVEYAYPQSEHAIRMLKPKVSRRRPSVGGLEEVALHHNIGVATSNDKLPQRENKSIDRKLVYTSDKSGETLSSDIRSCDYSKLLMSSSAYTEDQDGDEKAVSTETMAQFNDLTKETSRYLCSRQYDTDTHGTYTGSSFFLEAADRDTNTICNQYIDTAVSSPNLIEMCNFNGGPITHHVHKAVSTQSLVRRYSFNGGSHRSQRSFIADVHPDYTTNCTSMTEQSVSKPTGVKSALIRDIEKQTDFEDKFHANNSSDSSSSGFCRAAPTKRAVAVQVVLDNEGHESKSRRVLSTSVGIFTSLHGLSQSIQTPINRLGNDNELGVNLIPATSKCTHTSCHMAGAAVQTGFKTSKKTIGTQLPIMESPENKCSALTTIEHTRKSCLSKKSISAMEMQSFIHCQAVPKSPKVTSSDDTTTEGTDVVKSAKKSPTNSTMVDKLTTTDQELKCVKQEIKSNVRNIGIHVNFQSKINRTAKELNKKVSLPIKRNKWDKGKLKEYLYVYDIPHIVPNSVFTEHTSSVTSIRSSHILYDPIVKYVSNGAQTSAREWKLYNDERKINKGVKHRMPSSGSPRNLKNSNIIYLEACTMKPSTNHNAGCQTYEYILPIITIASASTCSLSQALSLTDICEGIDKHELQAVLSAIEGRIRRLKRNIRCRQ